MPIKGTYRSVLRYVGAKGGTVTTDVEIIAGVKFTKMYVTGKSTDHTPTGTEKVTATCIQDENRQNCINLTLSTPSKQNLTFIIDTTEESAYHVTCRNREWRYLDYNSVINVLLTESGCSETDREYIVKSITGKATAVGMTNRDILRNRFNVLQDAFTYVFPGTSADIGTCSADRVKFDATTVITTVTVDGQFYTVMAQDNNQNELFEFTNGAYRNETREFTFKPGTVYTLKVQNEDNSIYVFVNGVPLKSLEEDMFKADVIFKEGDEVEIRQKNPYTFLLKDTRSYVIKHRDVYTLYLHRGDVTDVCTTPNGAVFELYGAYVGIACTSFSRTFSHYILTVSPDDLDIVTVRFVKKYTYRRPDISQQRFGKECRFECRTVKYVPRKIPVTVQGIIQESQGDGFVSTYLQNVTSPVHAYADSLKFYRGLNKSLKLTLEKEDFFDSPHKVVLKGYRNGVCGHVYSTGSLESLFKECGVGETDSLVLFSECSEYAFLPPEYLFR